MTTLAIMQPYFLPYLGYWQLINAVDRFVIYDDVHYINRGWINRNRILINGAAHYITVPLQGASQNQRICDLHLQTNEVRWQDKMLKSIETSYRRAPCFDAIFPSIESLVREPSQDLPDFLFRQLQHITALLGIKTQLIRSSSIYGNAHLKAEARIIDICQQEAADRYINAAGGRALYEARHFAEHGIELRFLAPQLPAYTQRAAGFTPGLSIVDALMELGAAGIQPMLSTFELAE